MKTRTKMGCTRVMIRYRPMPSSGIAPKKISDSLWLTRKEKISAKRIINGALTAMRIII